VNLTSPSPPAPIAADPVAAGRWPLGPFADPSPIAGPACGMLRR
jgi:hypothetical protein